MTEVLIWIFSTLAVVSAMLLVLTRNILYGACLLVICLMSLAALYVLLQAEFVGITQLMIYVGGVVILLLFAIMLTNKLKGESLVTRHYNRLLAIILFVSALLAAGFMALVLEPAAMVVSAEENMVHAMGVHLMTTYIFPMEMIAVLLLLVLIGAITIAGSNFRKEGDI